MATRSAIGYARPNGSVRAVYCHWNGYTDFQMPILQQHYNTVALVKKLIAPGSMSNLRTTETWESDYSVDENGRADFNAPRTNLRNPQPLYHAERGNNGPWNPSGGKYAQPPVTRRSLIDAKEYWRDYGCEYLYIYVPRKGWQVTRL